MLCVDALRNYALKSSELWTLRPLSTFQSEWNLLGLEGVVKERVGGII